MWVVGRIWEKYRAKCLHFGHLEHGCGSAFLAGLCGVNHDVQTSRHAQQSVNLEVQIICALIELSHECSLVSVPINVCAL